MFHRIKYDTKFRAEPADKLLRLLNERSAEGKHRYNMYLAPGQMTGRTGGFRKKEPFWHRTRDECVHCHVHRIDEFFQGTDNGHGGGGRIKDKLGQSAMAFLGLRGGHVFRDGMVKGGGQP